MEYRGVEYTVLRTMSPNGWRWIVKRDQTDKAGEAAERDRAVRLAKKYIDDLIKSQRRKAKGRLSARPPPSDTPRSR